MNEIQGDRNPSRRSRLSKVPQAPRQAADSMPPRADAPEAPEAAFSLIPRIEIWSAPRVDAGLAETLSRKRHLPPLAARVLAGRFASDGPALERYLKPNLQVEMRRLIGLSGMENVAKELASALETHRHIHVVYNEEVDGVCAAALCVDTFAHLPEVTYTTEGTSNLTGAHGLSLSQAARIAHSKAAVVLMLGTGTAGVTQTQMLRDAGKTVLIIDTHPAALQLPDASAIVNPTCPGSGWDTPEASPGSSGLAYVAIGQMFEKLRASRIEHLKSAAERYRGIPLSAWAALPTFLGVLPAQGFNRALARQGFEALHRSPHLGIIAMKEVPGLFEPGMAGIDSDFGIGGAQLILRLAAQRDHETARPMALNLAAPIKARQELERAGYLYIRQEAERLIKARGAMPAAFVVQASKYPGQVRYLARRLNELYSRPAVVFSGEDASGKWFGAACSLRGEKQLLAEVLTDASVGVSLQSCLVDGERARLVLNRGSFGRFAESFEALVALKLRDRGAPPVVRWDIQSSIVDLQSGGNVSLDSVLGVFEPIGRANPSIRILLRNVRIEAIVSTRWKTVTEHDNRKAQAMRLTLLDPRFTPDGKRANENHRRLEGVFYAPAGHPVLAVSENVRAVVELTRDKLGASSTDRPPVEFRIIAVEAE